MDHAIAPAPALPPTAPVEPLVDALLVFRDLWLGMARDGADGAAEASPRDLTARQMAIFLLVHLSSHPQTVSGLARRLDMPSPNVSRAIDRLEEMGLVRRGPPASGSRGIGVGRTPQGEAWMAEARDALPCAVAIGAEVWRVSGGRQGSDDAVA